MYFGKFDEAIAHATASLMSRGVEVDTGSWQGVTTEGHPDLVTIELMQMAFECPVDRTIPVELETTVGPAVSLASLSYPDELTPMLAAEIEPNLPWADAHFDERVSRNPSNPGVEYENWPWWGGQDMKAMVHNPSSGGNIFDHTYQERFWPKEAGQLPYDQDTHWGIRYEYGDLDDVVSLLYENPGTRQATFPIFFPEDTGAVHGGRIPCTLHYHFLLRNGRLNMWYPIRSCDLVRHFRDDLYLACRLMIWVLQELQEKELRGDSPQLWVDVRPGVLFFNAYSFHVHKGDLHHVRH